MADELLTIGNGKQVAPGATVWTADGRFCPARVVTDANRWGDNGLPGWFTKKSWCRDPSTLFATRGEAITMRLALLTKEEKNLRKQLRAVEKEYETLSVQQAQSEATR